MESPPLSQGALHDWPGPDRSGYRRDKALRYHALSILQCLLDQIYHMEHNTDSKYTKQSYVILILFQIQSLITSYLASGFSEMHIAF